MQKITLKEFVVFSLCYYNKLDKNGELAKTKMNRIRYKVVCKLVGGEDKLDDFIANFKTQKEVEEFAEYVLKKD